MYCEKCGSQVDPATGVCAACAGRFHAGGGNSVMSPPRLEWRGLLTGHSTEITSDYTIVGKDNSTCQVVVDDDVISFRHSALEMDGHFGVTLVDLASAGGTFVNGTRITRHPLRDGDLIAFGPDGAASCVFRAAQVPFTARVPFPAPAEYPAARVTTGAEQAAAELKNKVKIASKDASQALRTFAANPVGGLPAAFEGLGDSRAMGVGFVFAAASILLVFMGVYFNLSAYMRPSIGASIEFFIFGVVPFASILAASAATRKVFRGAGSLGGDSLIAGASLLPFGFLVFVGGLLGFANLEVTALLVIFALCYTILILYTGCTRISGVSESKAAFAVPVMIIVSGWLTKILFGAILPSFLPSPRGMFGL